MAGWICLSRFGCRNRPFYLAMAAGIASTHRDLIGYSFPGDDGCNSRTSSPHDQFGRFYDSNEAELPEPMCVNQSRVELAPDTVCMNPGVTAFNGPSAAIGSPNKVVFHHKKIGALRPFLYRQTSLNPFLARYYCSHSDQAKQLYDISVMEIVDDDVDKFLSDLNLAIGEMNKENDALAQKEALEEEEDIQSMKDEYVRDIRPHLVAACVVMPYPLDSDYAAYTHGPTHGFLKHKPVYLSALDLMISKREMTEYQWECLFAHIIKKRIVIADDWTNSYGKIKMLFHQFIMKDSDNSKAIFMGVCDGQFIPLFKADGTPEEFGLATLAYILWKKNMLIAARVLKGVRCRNSNVAECLACSALMQYCLKRGDVDELSISTDSGAVHRAINGESVDKHGPNSDEYALLKYLASKFENCTSIQQPREVIYTVDKLIREMKNSNSVKDSLEKVLAKFAPHFDGEPLFRFSQNPRAKDIINKFGGRVLNCDHKAQEKSYIHVCEESKVDAYRDITLALCPSKMVLVFDSFEKRPLSFQKKLNEALPRGTVKSVEGKCTTFTVCKQSDSYAKVDESSVDKRRTMVFVFDATLPVDSYKRDEACTIILASGPHELRLMAQRGVPEMNTSTFLRFCGVEKETKKRKKRNRPMARGKR